ncbi:anti-sigma factor [Terriglobus albidus]|uniref:anti-sigma factor n=1 Tax=Terriglobus albidus TaxID=1592106 RepID=UPI0021DF6573|nr:hypothetical protein [Terriglobus albidus]
MNTQWHDEFVGLCALYPSGELTEEEWALLQVHLAYCESCQELFAEYRQIADEVVPAMAAAAAEDESEWSEALSAAEKRLMGALDTCQSSSTKRVPPRYFKMVSSLAIAAGIAGIGWLGFHFAAEKHPSTFPTNVATVRQDASPVIRPTPPDLRPQLQTAQKEITDLRAALDNATKEGNQANRHLTKIREHLQVEQKERQRISGERDAMDRQLAAALQQVESLREKTTSTANESRQYQLRLTILEARLNELSGVLEEKERTLAFDRELLARDRDIRELIGARDLYIADILDVTQTGKTSRPFGRIFYTKDKSLVFYGYDLDKQPGLKRTVAFQAWGNVDEQQNVSLGLFYQEDTKKRWVLRFNDTKTLAHLNKVFVTAEPLGGSTKPTGKPLLMADLQIQPNHP